MAKRYWLFKSDPESFSFGDLKRSPKQTTFWDGVRNYQVRNWLRDEIRVADGVLFYHSSSKPPAILGTATVTQAGASDPTQFDSKSPRYDPGADPKDPRWFGVEIRFEQEFKSPVSLDRLRETPGLEKMILLQRGSRLSVQPVTAEEWKIALRLGAKPAERKQT